MSSSLGAARAICQGRSHLRRYLPPCREYLQQQVRRASSRHYYLSGGSNPVSISEETKDLLRNQKTIDNIDEWKRGYGIQDPVRLSIRDPKDIDNDQYPDAVYYPHKGEEWPENYNPSPVFLVKRVKSLCGEPYWHKEACERIGLGEYAPNQKVVVLPNTPTMCYKLFSIKHLVEIVPVSFPMGFPSDEEFDPAACRINHKGEFYYHPKLKVDQKSMEPADQMPIAEKTIYNYCWYHWHKHGHNSPLGNSNYHRDTRKADPSKWNKMTDSAVNIKYQEDIKKFSKYIK